MSKNRIQKEFYNLDGVSILIRNMEASLLYYLGTEQSEDHKKVVEQYRALCSKKNKLRMQIKETKDRISKGESTNAEVSLLNEKLTAIDTDISKDGIKELGKRIFKMDKSIGCTLKGKSLDGKDNRYYYKGNLTDSLMRRELLSQIEQRNKECDKFRVNNIQNPTVGFADVIINISFKTDFMVKDTESKNGTFYRNVINHKKLRDMFYRDGVWIDGAHFVEFQRSSSKARTGDCLFIKEQYLVEMLSWQRLGLDFRKEVFKADGTSFKKSHYVKIDITGARSYESLTSSSIIGEVKIDPYNILLIDDVAGKHTMKCNVVESVKYNWCENDKNGNTVEKSGNRLKALEKEFEQTTDLWDGQSLVDESVFDCIYQSRNKKGQLVDHSFKNKGFLLLRNHFLKSAGFNTKLRKWFMSDDVVNTLPVNENGIKCAVDKFGNLLEIDKIQMVTTKNSVKIFKEPFATCILYDEIVEKGVITHKNGTKYTVIEIREMTKLNKESLIWDWYRLKIKSVMGDRVGVCKYEKASKFLDGQYQQLAYQMLNSLGFTKEDIEKLTEPQIREIMQCKNNVAFFKNLINSKENSSAKQSMMIALMNVNDRVQNTQLYKDFRDEQIKRLRERILAGKLLTEGSDYCVLFGNPYEMLLASAGLLDTENDIALHSIMGSPEQTAKSQFECYCPRFNNNEELFGFRSPHICESNAVYLINKEHEEYKWFNALTVSKNIVAVNFHGFGAFLSPKWNGSDVDSDAVLLGNNETVLKRVIEAQDKLLPINGLEPKARELSFTEENLSFTDSRLANDYIGRICNLAQNLQSYYWHLYHTKGANAKYIKEIYDDVCILEVLSNIAIDSAKREYPINIEKEIRRINKREYLFEKGAIIDNDSIAFEEGDGDRKKIYFRKPKFMMKKRKFSKKKYPPNATEEEKKKIDEYNQREKYLIEKMYLPFNTPMDIISMVLDEKVIKAKSTPTICINEILNYIPSGDKADYNRIHNIINRAISYGKELNDIQNRYGNNEITGEGMYEQKKAVEIKAIEEYSNIDLSANDVIILLKKVYEVRDRKDTNGKIVKKKGIDKRDKSLLESKMGSRMLQWVFMAHKDIFLSAIKESGIGTISHLVELPNEYDVIDCPTEIFEQYGKQYIILKEVPQNYSGTEKIYRIQNRCYIAA